MAGWPSRACRSPGCSTRRAFGPQRRCSTLDAARPSCTMCGPARRRRSEIERAAPGRYPSASPTPRARLPPESSRVMALRRIVRAGGRISLLPGGALAQQYDGALFAGLRWRLLGPFRGGRTVAAAGVPSVAGAFYIGVNNGGVWKPTDYGRPWPPIFEDQPTASIGAIASAPSDPGTIYVGSGEGLQRPDLSVGDGIYKSVDAGATWRHLGLRDGQQIPAILVDPRDPNRVFAAVLGHPYGPNAERGVFRSTDGGETWTQVLHKDENTGAVDLAFAPADPQTVFGVLWAARQAPLEIGRSCARSANNGLYKSDDGGTTWRQVTAGLPGPAAGLGRLRLGRAPNP